MAVALHKTSSTDTLQLVARLYYDVLKPTGEADRIQEARVIRAIRQATPTAVTNLTGVADNAVLGANKTLFVPTIRQLNRMLLLPASLPAGMAAAMRGKGFRHARKLLRRKVEDVIALMAPTYTEDQVRRAYVVTQFFNLDGMDPYTATYLYGTLNITTLAQLGGQSPGTLLPILQTLVGAPHNRPSQLTQQKHEERWPREARLYGRSRTSEAAKAHWTRQFVPHLPPSFAREAAEYHERAARRTDQEPAAARASVVTATLHRFQERTLAGHRALLAGRHREAIGHYEAARGVIHGWLFESGVVSNPVDPKVGVPLNSVIVGVKRLLEALPDGDVDAPEAPVLRGGRSPRTREYGVRGFRFTELTSTARTEIGTDLAARKLRAFPPEFRRVMGRQVLDKLRSELASADAANLTQGLSSGTADMQVRDFDPEDRQRVVRNLGASNFSVLGAGSLALMEQPELQSAFRVSGMKSLVSGGFWSSATANQKVDSAALSRHPAAMASESPFVRFVALPSLEGQSVWQTVRIRTLDNDFVTDWVNQFLKPRLQSNKAGDLYPRREVWESPSAFAIWIPWMYGKVLPRGLALAHSRIGSTHTSGPAPVYTQRQVNVYDTAGNLVGPDRHAAPPSDLSTDQDLAVLNTTSPLPATTDTFEELQEWVQTQIAEADRAYGSEDLDAARSLYQDVVTAIELFDPTADYDEDASTVGAANYGNDNVVGSDPPDLWQFEEGGIGRLGGILYEPRGDGGQTESLGDSSSASRTMFLFNAQPDPGNILLSNKPETNYDTVLEPNLVFARQRFGWSLDDDAGYKAYLYGQYLYACANLKRIDLGINALGYQPQYVPPWRSDHLYALAQNMCNRALEAEQRVLSLLQLQEAAAAEELAATNTLTNARQQVQIARARQDETAAQNDLALAQAELAALQTEIAARQNNSQGWSQVAQGVLSGAGIGSAFPIPGLSTLIGAAAGGLIAGLPLIVGALSAKHASSTQSMYDDAATHSADIVEDTQDLASASLAVATEEYDAAVLAREGGPGVRAVSDRRALPELRGVRPARLHRRPDLGCLPVGGHSPVLVGAAGAGARDAPGILVRLHPLRRAGRGQ